MGIYRRAAVICLVLAPLASACGASEDGQSDRRWTSVNESRSEPAAEVPAAPTRPGLRQQCLETSKAILQQVNPQWRALVLANDDPSIKRVGAEGWAVAFTQVASSLEAQGCVGSSDFLKELSGAAESYRAAPDSSRPEDITVLLRKVSNELGVPGP
jgi:hypothetical protein